MKQDLTTSVFTFEDLIKGNFLYVDKTEYIWQLIRPAKGMYFLSRPRRFGSRRCDGVRSYRNAVRISRAHSSTERASSRDRKPHLLSSFRMSTVSGTSSRWDRI